MRWQIFLNLFVGLALAFGPHSALSASPMENPNFLEREIEGAHVGQAVNIIQSVIEGEGYTFMGVQNIDDGLNAKGFEQTPYKIVFLGDREAFEEARAKDPRVTPYLPLKITIYEGKEGNTHLSAVDPRIVGAMFNPGLQHQFLEWSQAIRRILEVTSEKVRAGTWPGTEG